MSRFDEVAAHDVMRNVKRVGFLMGLLGFTGCQNGGKVLERSSKIVGDSGAQTGGSSGAGGNPGLASGGAISDAGAIGDGGATGDGGAAGTTGTGGMPVNPGGAAGAGITFNGCNGACCPSDTACYATALGKNSPGAECLATKDNTGQAHVQLRQQWVRATRPAGNAIPLVYAVLAGRTQLPWKACNQTGILGSGGDIELVDLFLGGSDISKHYATIGYSTFVQGPAIGVDPSTFTPSVISNGFCFGQSTLSGGPAANGNDYGLSAADVGGGADYPLGLPHPMALKDRPWVVRPTKLKRLPADFDLTTDRTALLAKLDPVGEYGSGGFQGVFFYDDSTGTAHGFASLSWNVIYDAAGATYTVVPMREVETRSRFDDPASPNCVGAYLADALDPATCTAGQDPTNPGWGGGDCTATTGNPICNPGESPASTTGYFLITELEQIYSSDLQNTLCVTYPGNDPATSKPVVDAQGFYDAARSSCKTAKWNPSDPANGIPMGDWCAATNAPATVDCHDAWRGQSFQTFAGAKIHLDSAGSPAACPF